jgi:hypothetical protein
MATDILNIMILFLSPRASHINVPSVDSLQENTKTFQMFHYYQVQTCAPKSKKQRENSKQEVIFLMASADQLNYYFCNYVV